MDENKEIIDGFLRNQIKEIGKQQTKVRYGIMRGTLMAVIKDKQETEPHVASCLSDIEMFLNTLISNIK
ncbi:MAG: hypothetical protein H6Q15_2173 [Bacteroidetes bacterium]|nr:hypothetical protein [Bacteroidota bacterium]